MSESWDEVCLGELIDLKTGFPFKSSDYTISVDEVKLLRGDNIVPGGLRWEGVQRWDSEDAFQYADYFLESGDLVIAMDRPWINSGLKYAQVTQADIQRGSSAKT